MMFVNETRSGKNGKSVDKWKENGYHKDVNGNKVAVFIKGGVI